MDEPEDTSKPDSADLYKSRAAEYLTRYENMRTLEWKVLFQVYVGYAAIAVLFARLIESFHFHWMFRIVAMVCTLIFFVAIQYLYFRIQERLILFNETHEAYMNKVRPGSEAGLPKGLGQVALGHQYFWTYDTQLVLSTLTLTGILAYEAVFGFDIQAIFGFDIQRSQELSLQIRSFCFLVSLFLVFVLFAICYAVSGRRKLQRKHCKIDPRVWYVSYGSNLSEKRFMCYIAGGTPPGSQNKCRDKTPPMANKSIVLNWELYFAVYSDWWHGTAAFIRQSDQSAKTFGRMYLITDEQFNDVVLQENGRAIDGTRLLPPFGTLMSLRDSILPGVEMYGRLVCLGKRGGYPMLTFTATKNDFKGGPPSEAYVKVIVSGIKETYPSMKDSEIWGYLQNRDGIRGKIPPDQLKRWIVETT